MSEVDTRPENVNSGGSLGSSEASLRQSLKPLEREVIQLVKKLQQVEADLQKLIEDKEQYKLLDEIGDRLEALNELGGGHLLWGEDCSQEESARNFERIQNLVGHYDELCASKENERDKLAKRLHSDEIEIALIHDEILLQQILAEERQYDFVLEREPRLLPYRQMDMPWYVKGEDEKRFRKAILIALSVSVFFGILIPLITLPKPEKSEVVEIPERLAKMIAEKKPPPKPKEESERPREDTPDDKPKPTEKEEKVARKKAEKSGLLAFKDNFSDLMDTRADAKLGAQARITNAGQKAARTDRSIITAQATTSSGGISSSALSRDVGVAGQDVGAVEFSRVESAIGTDFEGVEVAAAGSPLSRSDEDIQIVFDRYKAALYRIYNRELRANPTLRGRMVLRITIRPDGTVAKCVLDSSDMKAPALESKIIARVRTFNFGKKEGANSLTILYPIDFLPAS